VPPVSPVRSIIDHCPPLDALARIAAPTLNRVWQEDGRMKITGIITKEFR
jgi:hypothetical protein